MPERPKIAVVGLRFGNVIAHELSKKPASDIFELAALCDATREQADMIGARHPGVPVYYDLNDVLARKDIPAIALLTPPVGRAALIHRCLAAGKAVMTTKPFERDIEAARAVLAEAARLKIPVHLNSPAMVSPAIEQIKKWVEEKKLGRIVGARTEVWAYKPKPADGSWYDDPVKCPVAPVYRVGIYIINTLVSLFGEAEKATVVHSRLLTGRPTPDNAQLGLLFRNGGIANVFVSFCVDDGISHNQSMTINFERGTVYWNVGLFGDKSSDGKSKLVLVTNDGTLNEPKPLQETIAIQSGDGGYFWDLFLKAMQGKYVVSGDYNQRIIAGLQIIDAMARAEQSGRLEEVYRA